MKMQQAAEKARLAAEEEAREAHLDK